MAQSHFSLAWDAHKANICHGLSALQQNGEFVDMTLAADGHMVKVHQVILALASPFIKELIASADCSHPVIFLNKISYETLCSILEYIYTGEVLVSIQNLDELVAAGKELHIQGLADMKLHESLAPKLYTDDNKVGEINAMEDDICYFEISYPKDDEKMSERSLDVNDARSFNSSIGNVDSCCEMPTDEAELHQNSPPPISKQGHMGNASTDSHNSAAIQFTVSNQGSLQIILNRYIYYLKHTNKNNTRNWRCVDYLNGIRCPAQVITKEDIVMHRISAHKHAFHDKKILKKIHAGAVFTAIHEAEMEGNIVREQCFQDKQKCLKDGNRDE